MADSYSRRPRPRPPQDLLTAVRDTVLDFGPDQLAKRTAASVGVIYNKATATESSHHIPTLADAVIWPQITGDDRIPEAYCRAVGGVFVSLRGMEQQSDLALLDLLLERERRDGAFAKVLAKCLANGRIEPFEYPDLHKAAYEIVAAQLELLARLEAMSHG